jgi:hypothetical protein
MPFRGWHLRLSLSSKEHLMGTEIGYEMWFSLEDNGDRLVALTRIEEDGQRSFVESEVFGPFDTPKDVCSWLWAKLLVDMGASLN